MDERQIRTVLVGIAAETLTLCEMHQSAYDATINDQDIISEAARQLRQFGMLTPDYALAAASAVNALPQPLDEPAEERARREPIEKMLGLTSPEDQLIAAIRAKELLEELARLLADGAAAD